MCGIAGYVGWRYAHEASESNLAAMCDAIRHRGPDDEGHLVSDVAALGMRRLSIIDLDSGRQPIANEDGTIHIVFNGEIYNYKELRTALQNGGHRLSTHSDTETLVHLYEDRAEHLVDELNGMFAFAIWDERNQTLLLARDRLGIKPLYYWEHEGGLAFASDLKSLSRLPQFDPDMDERALLEYMMLGYVPDPHTIFSGVHKLPPGHTLTWNRESGIRTRAYWRVSDSRPIDISHDDAVAEIRRLLDDAVRIRLIADVPLGAFLSGGTDSSAVVATMARQSSMPVRTFSIGFEEDEYNEAAAAAQFARQLGTDHTELIVRPDADSLVEEVVDSLGEPFADSSAIPTLLVSRLASRHVKVALSGDGGDELFFGYTRYLDVAKRREVRPRLLRQILRVLGMALPQGAYGRNRILDLSRNRKGRYAGTVAMALSTREGGVVRRELVGGAPTIETLLDPWFGAVPERDFESRITLVDMMTYLPGDILTKVDRMSMACSLEARVPLLDHRMVELAASLPIDFKHRDGVGKQVFRDAIRDRVPREVLERRKQGFALPLDRWFRGDLRYRLDDILEPSSPIYGVLSRPAVSRVVAEHLKARRDHSHLLWRILVLHLWMQAIRAGRSRPC